MGRCRRRETKREVPGGCWKDSVCFGLLDPLHSRDRCFVPVVRGWLGAPYLAIAAVTDLLLIYFWPLYRSRTPGGGKT